MASLFRSSPQRPTVQIPQSAEPESGREETMNDEEEETVCPPQLKGGNTNVAGRIGHEQVGH
jgi:hypothetical protein